MTPPEVAEEVQFSPGILFGILADFRERDALYYLEEHGGRGTLTDTTDQLAAWENDTTVELLTEEVAASATEFP